MSRLDYSRKIRIAATIEGSLIINAPSVTITMQSIREARCNLLERYSRLHRAMKFNFSGKKKNIVLRPSGTAARGIAASFRPAIAAIKNCSFIRAVELLKIQRQFLIVIPLPLERFNGIFPSIIWRNRILIFVWVIPASAQNNPASLITIFSQGGVSGANIRQCRFKINSLLKYFVRSVA